MKPILFALTLASLFPSLSAHAGNTHIGNGGNARVCRAADGNIISVEFFDWWENRGIRPRLQLELGPNDLPYMDKVRLAIGRLARLSPLRAELYLKWAENFDSEMNSVSDSYPLGDPSDADSPFDPDERDGCKTEQLALQLTPRSPWEVRYLVRASLWNKLDQNGKAGLILHEVIYREAYEMSGHQNSVAVRFLNSLMASKVIETLNLEEFLNLLKTYRFTLSDVNGHWITLGICLTDLSRSDQLALSCSPQNYFPSQLTFFPSGNLESAKNASLLSYEKAYYPRQIIQGPNGIPYVTASIPGIGLCHAIHFTDQRKLRQLCEGDPLEYLNVALDPYPVFTPRAVLFDDQERVNGILMDKDWAAPFRVGERAIYFKTGENRIPLMFHPNGRVASGILAHEEEFQTRQGVNVRVQAGSMAAFDPEGCLLEP